MIRSQIKPLAVVFFLLNHLFFGFLPTFLWSSQVFAQPADPFVWNFDSQKRLLPEGVNDTDIEIRFAIPEEHYLYRDKVTLALKPESENDFEMSNVTYSPSKKKKDAFTGEEVEVYYHEAVLKAKVHLKAGVPRGGDKTLKMLLTYQGCGPNLCYRFERKDLALTLALGGTSQQAPMVAPVVSPMSVKPADTSLLAGKSFGLILISAFLGGVASDFTPCILPIIPITLAVMGVRKRKHSKNVVLASLFSGSMALTYALLGVMVAFLGHSFGFLFQNVYFLLFSILLYLSFSVSMFGAFEIQIPLFVRQWVSKHGHAGQGLWGAVISGATIGLLAAPCVGPLIAALLLYVAQSHDLLKGFLLLFAYGLGMASLFFVVSISYHHMSSRIRPGKYTVWVKRVLGVALLVPSFYYGFVLVQHFRPVEKSEFWEMNAQTGFERAKSEGKPVLVDFFATWCVPCVKMEKGLFSKPEIQALIREKYIPVKVDCTEETSQCSEYVNRYQIIGWPTLMIVSPDGVEQKKIIGRTLTADELKSELSLP